MQDIRSKAVSSIKINSRWFSLRYYLFFLMVLVFSLFFIIQEFDWMTILTVAIPIYVINFILGYYTIDAIFLKKKIFCYKVVILGSLSYVMVPFLVSYTHVLIDGLMAGDLSYWEVVYQVDFLRLCYSTFGINFAFNTLMLAIYYNTSIVVNGFGENPENHLKQDGQDGNQKGENNLQPSEHPSENSKTKEHLLLRSNRALTRIRLDEVVYLEVNGNNVHIQTSKSFYETRSSLGEILQGLPKNFVQINKSVVINLAFFEQLLFENDTKRTKAKVVFRQEEEDIEESFYIGRKFLPSFKSILSR